MFEYMVPLLQWVGDIDHPTPNQAPVCFYVLGQPSHFFPRQFSLRQSSRVGSLRNVPKNHFTKVGGNSYVWVCVGKSTSEAFARLG